MSGNFAAKLITNIPIISLGQNETVEIIAEFQNIGKNTWTTERTRIGTTNTRDRHSNFATDGWLSPSRPATLQENTPPGGVGRFKFKLKASVELSGSYDEHFDLVQEGVSWFEAPTPKLVLRIDVKGSSSLVAKPKKICILSTWNIKCGISQYCRNFYNALISRDYEVMVVEHTTAYDDICDLITKFNFDIFIVQFEAAIIKDLGKLQDCISKMKRFKPSLKVFFTIHSENAALHNIDGKIDGFIYHKKSSYNYKSTTAYTIPMGVPVFNPTLDKIGYRKQYNVGEDKFIISTLGFMFRWKQHAVFLEHMIKHLRQHSNIIIQFLTSFHSINNKECIEENNKITNIINANSLRAQVVHITDFISQEELNSRLFMSDLGFLWSGIETTSSSASLKEFVAARLPLVKTDSNHLHDINEGCVITNKDMNNFVAKIMEIYQGRQTLERLKLEMQNCYDKLNYGQTINKFIEIFNR